MRRLLLHYVNSKGAFLIMASLFDHWISSIYWDSLPYHLLPIDVPEILLDEWQTV